MTAVLEHKSWPSSQAFARVDVTDGGHLAFPQSTCPYLTEGLLHVMQQPLYVSCGFSKLPTSGPLAPAVLGHVFPSREP